MQTTTEGYRGRRGPKTSRALALVLAALSIACLLAESAKAVELFSEHASSVKITGAQEGTDVFKVEGGEVKCTAVKYETTVPTPPSAIFSLAATYSGCTFAGLATSITTNGCEFSLTVVFGTTDIVCPAGKEITIKAPAVGTAKCTLHIPPQANVGGVSYANTGAGTTREIIATLNLTTIKYSQTEGTAETGNCKTKDSMTTGTYVGKMRLTGEQDKELDPVHRGIYTAEEAEDEPKTQLYSGSGSTVTITGAQEGTDVFKVEGGEVKCTTAKYKATGAAPPTSAFSLAPTYSGCTFVGLAASIAPNGCEYSFNVVFDTTGIVCPAGKEITVTAPSVGTAKCILHIPPQADINGVSYSNIGAGTTREINVALNLTAIKYSQTKGTAETGNCETKDNVTTGTYVGKSRLTGEQDKESEAAHIAIYTEKEP